MINHMFQNKDNHIYVDKHVQVGKIFEKEIVPCVKLQTCLTIS